MTDIIELVRADHERVFRSWQALRDLAEAGGPARRAAGAGWAELAARIAVHADAEEEICHLPMYGNDPRGLARIAHAVADLDDIREAVREAALHPPGSADWRRAAGAALAAFAAHCDRQEREVLGSFGRIAAQPLRERLARQWLAFTAARAGPAARR